MSLKSVYGRDCGPLPAPRITFPCLLEHYQVIFKPSVIVPDVVLK